MEEMYCFEELKKFLNLNGIQVNEPYMPVDPNDVDWYDKGKNIEFDKDGIYLIKRNGGKQKVFLYRKNIHNQKSPFHVFCCNKVNKDLIGKVFLCANTGEVPVIVDNKQEKIVDELPICGYCAEKAGLDLSYNSKSYIQLLRKGQSIIDVHKNENLSVYSDDWQEVKEEFLLSKDYKCDRCGIRISDKYDRDAYLFVYHKNHKSNDNREGNLQCLCIECLSKVDARSVWINGANKMSLIEFRKKFKKH